MIEIYYYESTASAPGIDIISFRASHLSNKDGFWASCSIYKYHTEHFVYVCVHLFLFKDILNNEHTIY